MQFISNNSYIKHLFDANNSYIQQKILDCLTTPPSRTDGVGYVYGFEISSDHNQKHNFFVKIGRTQTSTPSERISVQGGNEIFATKTIFNRKLEKIIHLLFDFARVNREYCGKKQIEWFHFNNQGLTVINILTFVSIINSMVDDIFGKKSKPCDEESDFEEESDSEEESEEELACAVAPKKLSLKTCTINDLRELKKRYNIIGVGEKKMEILIKYKSLSTQHPGIGKETYKKLFPYVE